MTRVGSFDGEIGRGRQRNEDDSSSSRESSPALRRAPKRSLSPASDDGDIVIQNGDKDQPPPPAERPIIRKAVAFSHQTSQVPVNTYEADVQPKPKHFLPGQEVPLPPKPKGTRRNNGKRPRRPEAYPGQTSRFRLGAYDPTPPTEPPTTHGNGPYSSLYRNLGPTAHGKSVHRGPQPGPSNSVSIGGSNTVSNRGSFLVNNSNVSLPSSALNNGSNTTPMTQLLQTASTQKLSTNDSTSSLPSSQSQSQTHTLSPRPSSPDSHSHSTFVTDTALTARGHGSPSPYYRRNYDDKDFTSSREHRNISRDTSTQSSSPDSCLPGSTLVTLLISDVRSDSAEPDHQLAEVKVPLKKLNELEEGWWADAKDIAEQLQAGASRIDGPARVYTMRGKYRQFILRVTAENKDEIDPANVPVSAERTLDLTVEMLLPPSVPTRLQRPGREWSRTYDNHIQRPEERMDMDLNRVIPQSRKRHTSPSFDEYSNHSDRHSSAGPCKVRRCDQEWERSPRRRSPPLYSHGPFYTSRSNQENRFRRNSSSMGHGRRRRSHSPEYLKRTSLSPPPLAPAPLPTVHVGPGYPHREEDEDSDSDEPFIGAVECLLREDLEASYFKAVASNKVCDIVKQYEIVSKMFQKWVGKRPPGFSKPIEEIHIVQALEIDDSQAFIDNCKETMALLKLYGKRGRVVEDPRVITMLDDQGPPPVDSDSAERLLRQLRAVDDAWRNDRSGPLLNGITPPEPAGTFDKTGPYSPEPKSNFPGHDQIATASTRQHSRITGKAVAAGPEFEEREVDTARYSSRGTKSMFMD